MFTFAHNPQKLLADPLKPATLGNTLKMGNIEHFPDGGTLYRTLVKTKELTLKQMLSVPCPICHAATKKSCQVQTGARRTEPHRDRKLSAAEAMETKNRIPVQ